MNPGFLEGIRDRQHFKKQVESKEAENTTISSENKEEVISSENKEGVISTEKTTQQVDQEINELALQQRKQELEEAQQAVSKKLEEFRMQLPEKEGDKSIQFLNDFSEPKQHEESLIKNPIKWINERIEYNKDYLSDFSDARNFQNNKFIETLGITTPERLEEYLSEIDSNNPELLALMEKFEVENVHELANNPGFQSIVNLTGDGFWFSGKNVKCGLGIRKNIGTGFSRFFGMDPKALTKEEKRICNIFIKMINEDITEDLGSIPLQSASDEEIIDYLSHAKPQELRALGIYTGTRGENVSFIDFSKELLDDVFERNEAEKAYESGLNSMGYNTKEVEKAYGELKAIKKEYAEATGKIEKIKAQTEGYMKGINNKNIPANPFIIAGTGSAIGATVGTANEIRKGIFKKFAERVKGIFNRKKALPAPQSSDKVEETENTTKKSWKEKLKFIKGKETQEPKEKSPETIQASKDELNSEGQDNETEEPDREDDV